MNISPDDFKKIGIDSSAIQSKKEQTTYKIRYVTRYVRQWAIIEAGRKTISQINFIDCMCNAGIYKDGDFCTGMEVLAAGLCQIVIKLAVADTIITAHRKSLWFF